MKFDLKAMTERQGIRRREIALAPIILPDQFKKRLGRLHMRMLAPWADVWQRTKPIYEQELDRRLQLDEARDMGSLFDGIAEDVSRLIIQLGPDMENLAVEVERWHRGRWSRAVLAGTDIAIATMIGPEDARITIEEFLLRNASLIRNVSDDFRKEVADIVFRGLQERRLVRDVGRQIAQRGRISRRRANNIARDQLVKLNSGLNAQRQREAGLTEWKWRHSGKLDFRPEHKARDGNIYNDENAPEDLPGVLPFCGCIRQGIIRFD